MKKILYLCCLSIVSVAMNNNSEYAGVTPNALKKMFLGVQDPEAKDFTPESARLIQISFANQIINTAPDKVKQVLANLLDENLSPKDKPQRMLLVGEPGTGKSKIALAIMTILAEKNWGHKFIESALVANEYRNSGQQNISRIFDSMSKAKNVVTFDELTCLIDEYEKNQEQNISIATALWSIFDRYNDIGNNLFFIGTTNNIKKIPKPFKSRFEQDDMIIEVPLPSLTKRVEIISYYLTDRIHCCTQDQIQKLGKCSYKMSCRDIEGTVRCSVQKAAYENKELSYELILNLLNSKKPKLFGWKSIKGKTVTVVKSSVPYLFNVFNMALSIYLSQRQLKHSYEAMIASHEFQQQLAAKQMTNQKELQESNQKFQEDLTQEQYEKMQKEKLHKNKFLAVAMQGAITEATRKGTEEAVNLIIYLIKNIPLPF